MPLRDFVCSACGKTEERFFHRLEECDRSRCCDASAHMTESLRSGRGKTSVFPIAVVVDGLQTTISDIGALRAFERRFGVLATDFSQDPGNPDSPVQLPENRPGGRAYEGFRYPQYVAQLKNDGLRQAVRAMETGRYRGGRRG